MPIALLLFSFFRPPVAALLTLLGATMFLPSALGIDPPALPPMGKEEFASLGCLLGMLLFARPHLQRARLGRGPEILVVVMAIGAIFSVVNNEDRLAFGPTIVPGTSGTDFLADVIRLVLRWGVPFVAGRALFTRGRDVRTLLSILVAAGLVYSLLILVELRLSPQLHRWTYGYHQHSFSQTIRDGGYRPMVYMQHGLHVSLFIALCTMAGATLSRMRVPSFRLPTAPVTAWLGLILVLCKSVGSVVYGILTLPLLLMGSARLQCLVASVLAGVVVAYPMLRALDWIPVDTVVSHAEETFGEKRAHSLSARLVNERDVLERSRERIWFGWNNGGRSMIRDPISGKPRTTFDGYWVISIGDGGLVRWGCVFGMVLWPIFTALRRLPRIRGRGHRRLVGGLSLIVAISMFDLLPNATIEGYQTLFSGALAGVVPGILVEERRARRRAQQRRAAAAAPSTSPGDRSAAPSAPPGDAGAPR